MPISCPRTFSISSSDFATISSPFIKIEPLLNSAGGIDNKRIIDCTVTLFPEPDSPTIANVSPSCNSKFTSRTACASPPYVRNDTDKLFTSKTFFMSDSSQLIDDLLDLKRLLIRHQQH